MKKWLDQIKSKIAAENLTDLSDQGIENCFKNCVAGPALIELAKQYRDEGLLNKSVCYLCNYER
jgi:hypothetical protein